MFFQTGSRVHELHLCAPACGAARSPAGFMRRGKGGGGPVKLLLPLQWPSMGSWAGGAVGRQGIRCGLQLFPVYFKGCDCLVLFPKQTSAFSHHVGLLQASVVLVCVFLRR